MRRQNGRATEKTNPAIVNMTRTVTWLGPFCTTLVFRYLPKIRQVESEGTSTHPLIPQSCYAPFSKLRKRTYVWCHKQFCYEGSLGRVEMPAQRALAPCSFFIWMERWFLRHLSNKLNWGAWRPVQNIFYQNKLTLQCQWEESWEQVSLVFTMNGRETCTSEHKFRRRSRMSVLRTEGTSYFLTPAYPFGPEFSKVQYECTCLGREDLSVWICCLAVKIVTWRLAVLFWAWRETWLTFASVLSSSGIRHRV